MLTFNRLVRLIILLLGAVIVGTLGYILIERWSLLDALYMATITLSTVGFMEVEPLSPAGRIFTILLIFLGVGVIVYGFSFIAEYIVSLNMRDEFRKRRFFRMIKKLENHIVLCGYGRVGRSAALALRESGREVVVVDPDSPGIKRAMDDGFITLQGDSSQDEVLIDAGLERAWGIVITTGRDSLNLFIVLSAKSINSDLFIVARANQTSSEIKLARAGADRVVSPHEIGGKHMANIVVRPHVTDFFDVVTLQGGEELWIEEFVIASGCPIEGKLVGEADIRRKTGVTLVALYRKEIGANMVPDADTRLEAGDELIVLGTKSQLAALAALIGSTD